MTMWASVSEEMVDEPVKVGIIGTGFWGANHARVISELDGAVLTAICDINVERAKNIAKRYGIPRIYRDYIDLLRGEDVDAVTICTPSNTHAEICTKALEMGKDVLVEKPMASTLEESIRVMDAVKSSGRRLMVGFIERFNPAVEVAKESLESGRIGRPILIYGRRIGPWPERIGDIGVLKDTSIHDIDLSMYFFGPQPIFVYAAGGSLRHSSEDYIQALITFREERSAIIEANWLTPRKKRDLRITGTEGVIHVEFLSREVVIEKSDGTYMPMTPNSEPLKNELKYFITSLRKNEDLSPGCIEGVRAMAVAEAILQSMSTKKAVCVSEIFSEYGL